MSRNQSSSDLFHGVAIEASVHATLLSTLVWTRNSTILEHFGRTTWQALELCFFHINGRFFILENSADVRKLSLPLQSSLSPLPRRHLPKPIWPIQEMGISLRAASALQSISPVIQAQQESVQVLQALLQALRALLRARKHLQLLQA